MRIGTQFCLPLSLLMWSTHQRVSACAYEFWGPFDDDDDHDDSDGDGNGADDHDDDKC